MPLLRKHLLSAWSHPAGNDNLGALLGQPTRQDTRLVRRSGQLVLSR